MSRRYCKGEDVCNVGCGWSGRDSGGVASNITIVNRMRREILFRLEPVSIILIRRKQLNTIVTDSSGSVATFVCGTVFFVEDSLFGG